MASDKLFSYGSANVDSLLTTTKSIIAEAKDFLNDAIFSRTTLLSWLNEKGRVNYSQGGASILQPLLYGKNSTFKAYSKDDVLDTTGQEGITTAQFPWRNMGGTIVIFGDELRMNAGSGKIKDLLKAKIMQAMMSGRDALSIDIFASTQAAKKVSALPVLVDASATVGDINSSTNSWWQAIVTASGSFAARGQADMRDGRDQVLNAGQKGGPSIDFIVTTRLIYELYEASLVQGIRYESRKEGDATFERLKWSTAMLDHDPNVATGEMYMLASEALDFYVHSDANWQVGDFKEPVNQDTKVAKVIWMGNLCTGNRRRLVKLTGITA